MTLTVTKSCAACKKVKPLVQFHARARSRDGRQSKCAECAKALRRQWRETTGKTAEQRQRAAERTRQWREKNPERWRATNRQWAEANPERQRSGARRFRERNPEYNRKRLQEKPGLVAAYAAERRARLLQATPPWADKAAIVEIYERAKRLTEATGVEHHVDHIIPLKHRRVCGLHVPANLQILTAIENTRKSNSLVTE